MSTQDWLDLFGWTVDLPGKSPADYPGIVRAWHRYSRRQIDIQGAMKMVAYEDDKQSEKYCKMVELVASKRLQIIIVPGHHWHDTKTIGNTPSLTMYFVNNLYDYRNPDEQRHPYNDLSIIDPKTNEAYYWNEPPHK